MKNFITALGVFVAAVGIYCVFVPEVTIVSSGILLGIILVLSGISSLIAYIKKGKYQNIDKEEILISIVIIILGIIFIYNKYAGVLTNKFLSYCIAGAAFFYGIPKLYVGYKKKKESDNKSYIDIIIGAFLVLLGLFVIFNPLIIGMALGWLMGLFLAGIGINLFMLGITMKKEEIIEASIIEETKENDKIEEQTKKRIE